MSIDFAARSSTVRASAAGVVPAVYELFAPQSVLDVGCGQGEWMEEFESRGAYVFGVDIAAPEGEKFLMADLVFPLYLGRTFDLVVCLEVGEHLPDTAADVLVDSLTRHSWTILFSAAVCGQVGAGHINCQNHDYWHDKFVKRSYVVNDAVRPLIAHNPNVSSWYRNNVFLYLRNG